MALVLARKPMEFTYPSSSGVREERAVSIEDTSKRDPLLHLAGAWGNPGRYVEDMEAAGGTQFQAASELMPADGPWPELVALGFAEPEPTDDKLFVRTRLPEGWTKRAMDDPRGGQVLDERGVPRVGTFYKAASYDRKADCHLIAVGRHLATQGIYGDEPPARPELWDALTAEERGDYLDDLDDYLKRAEEYPTIYRDRVYRVNALKRAVGQ